jgi:hypothetical protein
MRHTSDGKPQERLAATTQQQRALNTRPILLRVRGASGAVSSFTGGKIYLTGAA